MKKFKIIAIFFLTLSILMCVSAVGCSDDDKIDALQQRITALEKENENLSEKLQELEDKVLNLQSNMEISGNFYTLQDAYEKEFITKENLRTIADYHNNRKPYPEKLSENFEKCIKRDWKIIEENVNIPIQSNLDGEYVIIEDYYGTYNDCVAVIVDRADVNYGEAYLPVDVVIDGVTFTYSKGLPQITVWKF